MNKDQPVYVSNAIYQIGKSKNWSSIAVLDAVNYLAKNGRTLSAQDIQRIKNRADHIYSSDFPNDNDRKFDSPTVQLNYDIVKMFEKSGFPLTEYLGGRYSKLMEDINEKSALNVTKDINLQKQKSLFEGVSSAERVLNETYELAATNPEFKNNIDNVFSNQFNSLLGNNENEVRTANPDFDTFLKTNGIIDATNQILSSNNELKSVINEKIGKLIENANANQNEAIEKIGKVGEKVENTNDKVEYLFEQIRNEQDEKNRIALENWEDYSLQSIISLATNIIGDPKLTKGVLAVTDAAFQIKNLLAQYNSVQNMSTLGSIGLISGYAGIALSLYSAFNAQGQQNADTLILENLQKISEQIEEFRKQVMEGISILDKKIDTYFEITNENLNKIISYLKGINIDLKGVRESLENLSLQINLYWRNLDAKLNYLINEDIEKLESEIKHFKSNNDDEEMSIEQFRAYVLRIFQIYDLSKKAVFTGDKKAISDYNKLGIEIEDKDFPELINLLREYISINSDYKLVNERVNPDRLNICMNFLIKLAIENPSAFKKTKGTKYQELFEEFKIQKKEVQEIRANTNDVLVLIFKKLTTDYLNSIKDFQKEVFEIYQDELVKYDSIKDKSKSNSILYLLESYSELAEAVWLPKYPDNVLNAHLKKAKGICLSLEFQHANYADWRAFINPSNGVVDFGIPEPAIELNPTFQYRGNSSFPRIGLTPELVEEVLSSCPSMVLLLSMNAIDIHSDYSSSYVNFARKLFNVPGWSGSPLESGFPVIYFRLLVDGILLSKPEISSPNINYISPESIFHDGTKLPKLKDLVPFSYSWDYKLDSNSNFPEFTENTNKLNDKLFLVINNYLLQVQGKVLRDLNDSSTDLYESVTKIETISQLLRLMINYVFEGINSDKLSYLTGDIKREIDIDEFKFENSNKISYLPLLDNALIRLIIASLKLDKSDIMPSLLGYDFHLFDNRFYKKCKETTEVIIEELVHLQNNDKLNSFLKMTDNQELFEMIIASKS
ncbi:hypothetical protein [Niabella aquatica]